MEQVVWSSVCPEGHYSFWGICYSFADNMNTQLSPYLSSLYLFILGQFFLLGTRELYLKLVIFLRA